jgi:uncharacterized membrane protein YhaH (DUF805 family)
MRGSAYHFDDDQDYGYVNGVDGKRYLFTRDDLSHGVVLARGTVVEFQPDDGAAHDIVASTTLPLGVDRPTQSGRIAADQPALGLWAYFRRALIADFINFNGRARRKEFWAFYLCSFVVLVALSGFGVLLNLAISGFGNGPRTSIGLIPALLFVFAIYVPLVALFVRRLHDIGLSGWFALLCFTPALNAIAFIVLGVIPSQLGENQWGQMPQVVRPSEFVSAPRSTA